MTRVLSAEESRQSRKDEQRNHGKVAALADLAIAEFNRKGSISDGDRFVSTIEINGDDLDAVFKLEKDKFSFVGTVFIPKADDLFRLKFKIDRSTGKRKSQKLDIVKDCRALQGIRDEIESKEERILRFKSA